MGLEKFKMRIKLRGFTLAEVLITLGIIGVVAAMTIPVLMSNHRKKVLSVSLQKAYSTITNGIRMSEIDNGMMSDWPDGKTLDFNTFWSTYLSPYFVGSKICNTMNDCGYRETVDSKFRKQWSNAQWKLSSTAGDELLFQLADGTVVHWAKNTYNSEGEIWYNYRIYIDVNGPKAPNTYCKDVYPFYRNKGSIIPFPDSCTELIFENSWEFPKDYPYRI